MMRRGAVLKHKGGIDTGEGGGGRYIRGWIHMESVRRLGGSWDNIFGNSSISWCVLMGGGGGGVERDGKRGADLY
ncbi:unnamed protein product [Dicrocoelium dendriticum]|nr:unnamed protein product [Dicrocoelium dendriticum]